MLPLTFSLLAQTPSTVEVQGQINDGTSPIPGATVLIKGEQRGTVSDFNGQFQINPQPNDTLVISYIGYATVEEPVNNRTTINITMQEDATTLREVVINAGYYSTTDRERTGSISRITANEIDKQPVNTPLEAIQGRMTGVDIVQNSGVPGSGFQVRIRGQNSIMAGNEPLYIINGVPYDSGTLGVHLSSGPIIPNASISPLNAINPENIESIEVLKDADATAIYGSRGANGVILITTKKGKRGKTKVSISSQSGIAEISNKMDLLNTQQYLAMRHEAFENENIVEYPGFAYDVNGTWDQNRYTDWQETLIGGTAHFNKMQASVTGGNDNTQFLLSGQTQKETTVFPGDFNYKRLSVNSNINHTSPNEKLTMTFTTGYSIEDNLLPASDLSLIAVKLPPNAPALYDENGELNWEENTWSNPLAQLNATYSNNVKNLIANAVLNYKLFTNLELKVNAGYNTYSLKDIRKNPHTIYSPSFGFDSSISSVSINEGNKNTYIIEPQIHWSNRDQVNSWNLLLGSSVQNYKTDVLTLSASGFPDNSLLGELNAAQEITIRNQNKTEYNYQSIFARINYSYKSKIFLNATGRRDGSSRFGPGNRFGNFGAIGAAWVFSDEIDLPWLSFGKLRASIGLTGNDQIGDYQYLQTYMISDLPYDGYIGLEPARLYNPDFQWEKNEKKEIAVELDFFNNRLNTTIGYYNNRSSNQLINYALPGTTGFTSIQDNLDALVENSGWEFEIMASLVRGINFNWETSFNVSLPKNKLLAFPGLEESTYANQYTIGHSLNSVKLYKLNGVNPETGLFEFEDYNGDGMITPDEDRQYISDLTPKYFGGLSNMLNYKNWSLNLFLQFVKKKGYNQYLYSDPPGTMINQPVTVLDQWQQPGDQSSMQQYTTGFNFEAYETYTQFTRSNGIISDASFLRVKSMSLTHTINFSGENPFLCQISLQGQNLWTFTNFKGIDPEQIKGFIPPLRRVSLGAKVEF